MAQSKQSWRRIAICAAAVSLLVGGGIAVRFAMRESPSRLVDRAMRLAVDNPEAAEQICQRVIASSGGHQADAELGLARLRVRRGNWPDALAILSRLDTSACRTDPLIAMSREALRAGHTSTAIELLESSRRRGGSSAVKSLELLLAAYGAAGKQEKQISTLQELVRLNPGSHSRHQELARLLKNAHREVECRDAARQGLLHCPPGPQRIWLEYLVLEQDIVLGDIDEAWQQIERLEREDPGSDRLQAKRVDLYRQEGRLEEALAALEKLSTGLRRSPVSFLTRGVINLDLGRYAEAVRELERFVAVEPFQEGARFKLSEAYRGLGQNEKSRQNRDIAVSIREKRVRMNALLKELEMGRSSPHIIEELVNLHKELGTEEQANYWQQRSESSRKREISTDRSTD